MVPHPEAGQHGYTFEAKDGETLKKFDYVLSQDKRKMSTITATSSALACARAKHVLLSVCVVTCRCFGHLPVSMTIVLAVIALLLFIADTTLFVFPLVEGSAPGCWAVSCPLPSAFFMIP